MNVLVLGGTQFVGRHVVEALARGGHAVTRFHRGHTNCEAPPNVTDRLGDRNGDLSRIAAQEWDAVVDVNAYEPHQVERTVALRTQRYVFISTVSVYADPSVPGIREDAPTIASVAHDADAGAIYGANKAACERVVARVFPEAFVLRPGLIAGPYDPTDRFTYWCERALRGGPFVAPEPKGQPVQFVDVRDVASFVALGIERNLCGTYNVVGPRETTNMSGFIDDLTAVANDEGIADLSAVWIDREALLGDDVKPWTELPLWLPLAMEAGILTIDNGAARAAGLTLRPARETIRATMEWVKGLDPDRVRRAGMTPEREAHVLERRFHIR
jgi:nucleoside-diphosphate-sugar epimerase